MLYRYQVKFREKTTAGRRVAPSLCEITLVPTRLGRWLGCQLRRGTARRARDKDDQWRWWWTSTERHVGWRIESMIEAAPIDTIEDMPVELLLEEARRDG